jgi:peptidoglycan/LPS O-acetylase OafA/YrhL
VAGDNHRLVGIDLIRLFAAWSVVVYHLGFLAWAVPQSTGGRILQGAAAFPELAPYVWWGGVAGVDVFFLLSGFVIAFTASRSSASRFLQNRFLRLFPAALVCSTISFFIVVGYGSTPPDFPMWLRSAVLWPVGSWIDFAYWTLGVEMAFYAVIFVALLAAGKRMVEPAVIAIGSLSAASWLWRLTIGDGFSLSRFNELALLDHGVLFASGAASWFGWRHGWKPHRIALVAVFAIIGAASIEATQDFHLDNLKLDQVAAVTSAVWLSSLALVICAATFDRSISAACNHRATVVIRVLSLSTYPLYLLHQTAGNVATRLAVEAGAHRFLALALALVFCLALSTAITLTAERWLRSAMRSIVRRTAQARRPCSSLPTTVAVGQNKNAA